MTDDEKQGPIIKSENVPKHQPQKESLAKPKYKPDYESDDSKENKKKSTFPKNMKGPQTKINQRYESSDNESNFKSPSKK